MPPGKVLADRHGWSTNDFLKRDVGVGEGEGGGLGARDGYVTVDELSRVRSEQYESYRTSGKAYDQSLWRETREMISFLKNKGAVAIDYLPEEIREVGAHLSDAESYKLRCRAVELLEMANDMGVYSITGSVIDEAKSKYREKYHNRDITERTMSKIHSEIDVIADHLNLF